MKNLDKITAELTKAKEQYEKTVAGHLEGLVGEEKEHLEAAREIRKTIDKLTGRTSVSSVGQRIGRGQLSEAIIKCLKDGPKSQKEIETALGKNNLYLKLQAMTKENKLSKSDDEGKVKYSIQK